MEELKLVFKGIQLVDNNVSLVDKLVITPQKFGAYKEYSLEVFNINKSKKEPIVKLSLVDRVVTENDERCIRNQVVTKCIAKLFILFKNETI